MVNQPSNKNLAAFSLTRGFHIFFNELSKLSKKVLAVILSLLSSYSAEFYDIRYAIPTGYRVDSVADWDNLYLALHIFFLDHPDEIPKFMRIADFKADATSTGGRGCIMYDFYAKISMNRGLKNTRNTLIGNL